MTEIEVQKEGARVKMNKGYIEIKFTAILEKIMSIDGKIMFL